MKLSVIKAKSTDPLDANEIEKVREIIGYQGSITEVTLADAYSIDLTAVKNQFVRALIDAWDAIGDSTEKLQGGAKGLDHSADRNRFHIANQLRRVFGLTALPRTDMGDVVTSMIAPRSFTW
jgi:hypothetical protein